MNGVNKRKLLNLVKIIPMAALSMLLLAGCDERYFVFHPKGPVAKTEFDLIVLSVVLCAIIIIPVMGIFVYIVWRYRDKPDNKAPYMPHWDDNKVMEIIWWTIPVVIIAILGTYTAKATFALTKPPVKDVTPITIQVTSLDWKWLFTYPDQNIASVNTVEIPAGVPVQFVLTSDAPMNSFWVPSLGGQEYTMPGMAMRLWLQADKPGSYFGSGANFTGEGFAHMQFKVIAKQQSDFNKWVKSAKNSDHALTKDGYTKLSKQGLSEKTVYSSYPKDLFDDIVKKNGGDYYKKSMNMDDMKNVKDMKDMEGMDQDK
jgi:cytochrome aa3-600 menaquinol oxidase subunit 2